MAFTLKTRRNWLFLPVILLELGMGYILDYFNIHPLWLGLILILIAVFLTALILWGKAIFHRSFYLTYRDIEREIHEITPNLSEEQMKHLFPEMFTKQEFEGESTHTPSHIVKEKIRVRKKRFEV